MTPEMIGIVAVIAILIFVAVKHADLAKKLGPGKAGDFLDDFKLNNSNVATAVAAPATPDHAAVINAVAELVATVPSTADKISVINAIAPVLAATNQSPMTGVDFTKPLKQDPKAPAPTPPPSPADLTAGITWAGPGQHADPSAVVVQPADFSGAPTTIVELTDDLIKAGTVNGTPNDVALDGQNIAVCGDDAGHTRVCAPNVIAALPYKGARASFIKNANTNDWVQLCASPTKGDFAYRRTDGVRNYFEVALGTDGFDINIPPGWYLNGRGRTADGGTGWYYSWHKA